MSAVWEGAEPTAPELKWMCIIVFRPMVVLCVTAGRPAEPSERTNAAPKQSTTNCQRFCERFVCFVCVCLCLKSAMPQTALPRAHFTTDTLTHAHKRNRNETGAREALQRITFPSARIVCT